MGGQAKTRHRPRNQSLFGSTLGTFRRWEREAITSNTYPARSLDDGAVPWRYCAHLSMTDRLASNRSDGQRQHARIPPANLRSKGEFDEGPVDSRLAAPVAKT